MSLIKIKTWIKTRRLLYNFLKTYYYLNHIRKYAKKNKHIPRVLYIETTNLCNARCRMCPHEKMKRERGNMSWELYTKIIDECETFEGDGLQINLHKDGEPLLDQLIFKRIKYAKQKLKKSCIRLNSNTMLLDEEKAKKLLNSDIDEVTFSVDGASKETYEKIRIGLKYDIVKENIERFFELRKSSSSNVRVIMQMVVEENNRYEIEEYKKMWLGKTDIVYMKAMHNFLDMGTSIKTSELEKKQMKFCKQPFDFMMIYWDGRVGLCCWDYDNIANLGDVGEDRLIDIYNNGKFKTIRMAMIRMDCRKIKPCNRCATIYGMDVSQHYNWEKRFYSK